MHVLGRRKIKRYEGSGTYPPTDFRNVELGKVRACASFDGKRVLFTGTLSRNGCQTAKFGEEIQLQVYAPNQELKVQKRNTSKWCRIEIFLSYEKLDELIHVLTRLRGGG